MQKLKYMMVIGLVIAFCCGMVSAAGADMVKKIIIFYEDVSQAERNEYASDWKPYGVSTVMDLPFMNGMVLMVPDEISSEDLANDYRVASVESDGKVKLQAITATGEGGAGEGGAGEGGAGEGGAGKIEPTRFITQFEKNILGAGKRPWGILYLYEHPYDPEQLLGDYDKYAVPDIIQEAQQRRFLKKLHIAILDTGIDYTHPRLDNRVKGGIDLVHMTPGIPMDDNGHGTHVAATLAARKVGLAKSAKIYAVKVLDKTAMGDISTMIMALQWAIDNGMDIVNMSFAFAEANPAVRLAVEKAYEAGLVMVAAVGNHSNWEDDGGTGEGGAGEGGAGEGGAGEGGAGEGGAGEGGAGEGGAGEGGASGDSAAQNPYPVMYPAAYPEVIAVGAMDSFGEVADFSNTGIEMDLIAPGTDIVSANLLDISKYGICRGTSMATPHVSGAVALMMALDQNHTLTPQVIEEILVNTAIDGRIYLEGALHEVLMR
jgi:subtilisin family serine protease